MENFREEIKKQSGYEYSLKRYLEYDTTSTEEDFLDHLTDILNGDKQYTSHYEFYIDVKKPALRQYEETQDYYDMYEEIEAVVKKYEDKGMKFHGTECKAGTGPNGFDMVVEYLREKERVENE